MQLFVLDYLPQNAAMMLCDKHLRKMCLENAQILSCLLAEREVLPWYMPKVYNPRHPVVLNLNTPGKINWCIDYNDFLHQEYFFRFGKDHSYRKLAGIYRAGLSVPLSDGKPETLDFARNFKDFVPVSQDIVQAYREYYCYKKKIMKSFVYTRRPEPEWLK